jgi:hypothetical protein
MAKKNVAQKRQAFTHEGGKANVNETPLQKLERSVMACLLWEDTFYEGGQSIADRIEALCKDVALRDVCDLAVRTRTEAKLRHAPLLLLRAAARKSGEVKLAQDEVHPLRVAVANTLLRADEPAELLALYWKGGDRKTSKEKLVAPIKKGIAAAFTRFNAYSLAKYNRDGAVKLRDVMFVSYPKPKDEEQAQAFAKLASCTLEAPDTWEVALSAGADKRETFERLLREGKLGYLALLRNLRNMSQSGVDNALIEETLLTHQGVRLILPFQFIAAERAAPEFSRVLDKALQRAMEGYDELPGKTVVCIDCSGSMDQKLSNRGTMTARDAAAGIAMCIKGDVQIVAFGTDCKFVPARKGLGLIDTLQKADVGFGTNIGSATRLADTKNPDRIIVITDMQSHDNLTHLQAPSKWIINVASYVNGIGEGQGYRMITGFSENTVKYISAFERMQVE